MATHDGWGTTERHSLSARHANGAPVAVEEDTAAVTKLLLVCLVAKSCKVVVGLLVGEEEKQTQELAMDTSRCRHARRQKGHLSIALIWVTIGADLVGSGALEDASGLRSRP